ncbi:antibiotic biosynthesis monooxygenase [Silicimonas algicola]|uniref:Antibiotic biosynthesis monooxygenase n=1 Tax=Silicimonas algicola TaxID=1826607 RepID=A0A316GEY3_9RHOB|nr:antibiotic biosynthesis monooxygenase [Silicimonas algicola]AZQ67685.1 antibiotic biosynthesis monooxygenase [Silicimonas algicola]PWK57910.1 antibiotic biosynthesis monooxygenase [Silicimonas algicola]
MTLHLTGRLICRDEAEAGIVRAHLAEHVRLTRDEPGCISFEVAQDDDPLVWTVTEAFADRTAFEAHQARTRGSVWGTATTGIQRDFSIRED